MKENEVVEQGVSSETQIASEEVQTVEPGNVSAELESDQPPKESTDAESAEKKPGEDVSAEAEEVETMHSEDTSAEADITDVEQPSEFTTEVRNAEAEQEAPQEVCAAEAGCGEVQVSAEPEENVQPLETGTQIENADDMKKKIISIVVTCTMVIALLMCIAVISQVLSKGYVSVGNYSLFRVVTGSMEPEIPVGSLLVSRKVDIADIEVGDIVNYRSKESGMFGVIITHRVIQIYESPDGAILLETKGDANQYADAYFVDQNYLVGKTDYYTKEGNFLAGILSFLTGKVGFLACIVIPCLLIGGLTMRDCVNSLREEMDAITKQLDEVEGSINGNSLERQLGEEAYQELCDRLRGELLEELKQGAETIESEQQPGADHQ